ncbi:MAG: 2-oxo-4-hydroxy-4-carboxy-5-ureidoimidazoline decarboxylase, partial [Polyangiaceae bacterium]
ADDDKWVPIVTRTKLQAHTRHFFSKEIQNQGPFTHLRLRIYPDGGVSRLRVHGIVTTEGREIQAISLLNALDENSLEAELRTCCGSSGWVKKMMATRPFTSLSSLQAKHHTASGALDKDDWLEAFRAHPRIGEKKAETRTGAQAATWASGEQARVSEASPVTLDALAKTNRAYEEKFGHIYIVCATGKTAEELLAIANERLVNDGATELARAADEQKKITDLRLTKLVRG